MGQEPILQEQQLSHYSYIHHTYTIRNLCPGIYNYVSTRAHAPARRFMGCSLSQNGQCLPLNFEAWDRCLSWNSSIQRLYVYMYSLIQIFNITYIYDHVYSLQVAALNNSCLACIIMHV